MCYAFNPKNKDEFRFGKCIKIDLRLKDDFERCVPSIQAIQPAFFNSNHYQMTLPSTNKSIEKLHKLHSSKWFQIIYLCFANAFQFIFRFTVYLHWRSALRSLACNFCRSCQPRPLEKHIFERLEYHLRCSLSFFNPSKQRLQNIVGSPARLVYPRIWCWI